MAGETRELTSDDRRIIEAARDIRPILWDVAGPDAVAIDLVLGALLERADAGENVAAEISALLDRHPATRAWLADRLYGSMAAAPATVAPDEPAPRPAAPDVPAPVTAAPDAPAPQRAAPDASIPATSAPEPTAEPPMAEAPPPTGSRRRFDFDRFRPWRRDRERSPTRSARPRPIEPAAATYAFVDCPEVVVAMEEFELVAGLADKPTPGVASDGPLAVPDRDFALSIDVHAEGFTLRDGETWRLSATVTAEHPRPRLRLHLTAKMPAKPFESRTIKATYCVDGQIVGLATRFVVVTRLPGDVANAPAPPPSQGVDVALPAAKTAPDLTARILIGDDNPNVAFWSLNSPWDVQIPADSYDMEVGDARAFLKGLVKDVGNAARQPAAYEELLGVGRRIATLIPAEFWSALAAVDAQVEGPPTVLFLSEEPYVPWELAVVRAPLDDSLPPFLGAQATVARWILGKGTPVLPPPRERAVASVAVVVGDYSDSDWKPLPEATKEAEALTGDYQAIPIDAQLLVVLDLLKGKPKVDLVHFAVHGRYDGDAGTDGLIMVDGSVLNGNKVLARPLDGAFVFLNACQVGAGNEILGGAAGLAADFVHAGASGVVAPLWSVNDRIAREIAAEFYARVLGGPGVSPAVALRECRVKFRDAPDASATYLAYQFFGAPGMRLTRP